MNWERVPWRRVAQGAVATLAVAGIAVWWTRPSVRFVWGWRALSATEAVLAARWNGNAPSRYWVMMADQDGVRWSVETTPLAPVTVLDRTSIEADADRVYAVLSDDEFAGETWWLAAFDRKDGAEAWRRSAAPPGVQGPLFDALILAGEHLVLLTTRRNDAEVHGFERATGTPAWTWSTDNTVLGTLSDDDAVAMVTLGSLVVLAARDGREMQRFRSRGRACEVDGGVLMSGEDALLLVPLGEGEVRPLAPSPIRYLEWCGQSTGTWVLAGRGRADDVFILAGVDAGTGAARWEREFPGAGLASITLDAESERIPARLPVVLTQRESDGASMDWRRVVVDSATGEIVQDVIDGTQSVSYAAGVAVLDQGNTSMIVGPDGVSGARWRVPDRARSLGDHVADGHWWVVSDAWVRPSALSFAVLDLASGELATKHGPDIVAERMPFTGSPARSGPARRP